MKTFASRYSAIRSWFSIKKYISCHGSLNYREHYADPHASRLLSSNKPIILVFLSRAHERSHSTALSDPRVFLARRKFEQDCEPSASPLIQNKSKTKRRKGNTSPDTRVL